MPMKKTDLNNKIRRAFANTEMSFVQKQLDMLNPKKGLPTGDHFIEKVTLRQLVEAKWEISQHNSAIPRSITIKSTIPGRLAAHKLALLPPNTTLQLEDKSGCGFVEAVAKVPHHLWPIVFHSSLIIGPDSSNRNDSVILLGPGDLERPTQLKMEAHGHRVDVQTAHRMGIKTVRLVPIRIEA